MPPDPKSPDLSLSRARSRGLILSVVVFSIFANLLLLTGPLFMLQVYDRVLGSRSEETLIALSILVVILYGIYGLLEFARSRVMARVGVRLHDALSERVFAAWVERAALRRTDKGAGATQDLEAVRGVFAAPVLLALFDLPWAPLFAAAVFVFHPLLGWLALGGGLLLIVVTVLNQRLTARRLAEAQRLGLVAQQFARQADEGADYIWAQGMTPAMTRRWTQIQSEGLAASVDAADWTGAFGSFSKAFRLLLQSAILAVGAWLVLQNQMTAGAMIAASILLGRALAPVEQVLGQWPMLQRARSGWRALNAFLADMPAHAPATELPVPAARLSVRGATVAARRGDRPVLAGISFDLNPGEALGVIGKSGSGKTTLARLVVGLVRPSAGEVRLDGARLEQYGPDRLGRLIGYLPQEVRLFDGTVAENIARMDPEPDAARVVAAARRAHVHDIILRLPDGYDTRLRAGDGLLSGGQRQRVGLARAIHDDPQILVLDEPNSALDADGSEALNEVVTAMKAAGKSVIIMTHRPTAIAACDRLLVVEGGRIVASGPRDDVIHAMLRNSRDVKRAVTVGDAARAPAEQRENT
jgi:ATP-binding cassette subfamily C protein